MSPPIYSAFLSWLGILGGTMMLFSHLGNVFSLAKWANWLANSWGKWVNGFWSWVLDWISIDLNAGARFQVTMALFIILIVVGCKFARRAVEENEADAPIGWRNICSPNVAIALLMFLALALFVYFTPKLPFFAKLPSWGWIAYAVINYAIYALCIVVGLARWPRFSAFSVATSMILMSLVFQNTAASLGAEPGANEALSLGIGTAFAILSGVMVLAMAPPRVFTKKVWFLFVGLGSIIGLNELSKLELNIAV